jgi:hypothetical protein
VQSNIDKKVGQEWVHFFDLENNYTGSRAITVSDLPYYQIGI